MVKNRGLVLAVVFSVSLVQMAPAAAADGAVATMSVGPAAIEWSPTPADFESLTLTVSGPDGVYLRSTFAAGAVPTLSLFDDRGFVLPDGVYTWELQATPRVSLDTRRQMAAARETGDDSTAEELRRSGALPARPLVQSGSFAIRGGGFVDPAAREAGSGGAGLARRAAGGSGEGPTLSTRDFVIADDLIVQGSACVGLDCINNENFGFDTIRLKENNLRIKFEDTSVGSFPTRDWEITINDSASGGLDRFSVLDVTAGRTPFTVEGNADANSLYVDTGRRVGIGTNNPVLNLHVKTGNTPALRLEQDGSSGFTAQTWDIAGNEANFFVRDVTGGSTLPFRIVPGAPSSSVFIANDGDVGLGTSAPGTLTDGNQARLHVNTTDAAHGAVLLQNASTTAALRTMIEMQNNGGVRWQVNDRFQVRFNNNQFQFDNTTNAGNECVIDNVGNLTCLGTKSFAVIDPEDHDRAFYYAALEGPEAGTYFRGTARIVGGEALVELPEHFSKLTEIEGMTVQLTPLGGWSQLYVAEQSPERLVIRVAGGGGEDLQFHYLVQGVRKGFSDFQVERPSTSLLNP